jgi:MFS family permease
VQRQRTDQVVLFINDFGGTHLASTMADAFDEKPRAFSILLPNSSIAQGVWSVRSRTSSTTVLIMRLLIDLSEAVTFEGSQLLVGRHTANEKRAMANGLIGAAQGVGPMLGTLFGGLGMDRFVWY